MIPIYAHSLGGQKMAPILRQKAVDGYYLNPNKCLFCDKIIEVGDKKVSEVRIKRFCNHSCATKFTNNKRPPRSPKPPKIKIIKNNKWLNLGLQTKGELFDRRGNWQSARSSIRNHASFVYFNNYINNGCAVCGYKHHIEVCHIKSVSSFGNDELINVINDINNLIGLCPNCHWEYDHGILKLHDRVSGNSLVS